MNRRWWETFRAGPAQAVADLFSGRAGVGSTLHLDVPELLYQAFPPSRAMDRALLDGALGQWLDHMRANYADEVRRLDVAVYGKRVGDALIAMQLLDLPETRERIRADVDTWVRWMVPLRLAPERDPALECWRLMTRGQGDARHTALWLRLAEDPRREYLTVALAGLTRLPNDGDVRTNQRLAIRAIFRHVAANYHDLRPARRLFKGHLAALQFVFPRAPEHWNQISRTVLEAEASGWPKVVVGLLPEPQRHMPHNVGPRPFKEWGSLESAIAKGTAPPEVLAESLFAALEQNHAFALATGVSDYFVRTLCNIGHKLLDKHGCLSDNHMTRLGEMVERAMAWEPRNPYCWTFWAEWFESQRNYLAREWVLREMVRLFPDNEVAHAELASTLMARGAEDFEEAERILRRSFSVKPGGGHSVTLLARLLRDSGRGAEAVDVLKAHLALHPDNDVVRDTLEHFMPMFDDAAATALGENVPDGPLLGQTQSPVLLQLERRHALGKEFIRALVAKETSRKLITAKIELEASKGDTQAGFYSQWLQLETTPDLPAHAWAWNACSMWQSRKKDWHRLAETFPEMAPQTEFLGLLAAQGSVDEWATRHAGRETTAHIPAMHFMKDVAKRPERIGPWERDDIARAVMESEATTALEFSVAATTSDSPRAQRP